MSAKGDFAAIKNISRDDLLAALRIPPQLMGIVPQNAGGFGSIRDAAQVWAMNELEPIQARQLQVNEWLGEEVVQSMSSCCRRPRELLNYEYHSGVEELCHVLQLAGSKLWEVVSTGLQPASQLLDLIAHPSSQAYIVIL